MLTVLKPAKSIKEKILSADYRGCSKDYLSTLKTPYNIKNSNGDLAKPSSLEVFMSKLDIYVLGGLQI